MTPEEPTRDAIVLSGGGALGAFEVGVMKALIDGESPGTEYQPLLPEIYTGTSVGAFNSAFLAARGTIPPAAAIDQLVEVWRDRLSETPGSCGSAAYRLRTAPFTLSPGCLARPVKLAAEGLADGLHWAQYAAVHGGAFATSSEAVRARFLETIDLASLLSPAPLYELIRDTISLEDLRQSPLDVSIATTDWSDGRLVMFSKREIVEEVGLAVIAASSAIPGIYPPIELRGVPFVDGGVLLNTPILPAIHAGADVIHVIYVDPRLVDMPLPSVPSTISTIYRMWAILQSKQINLDIQDASEIVEELRVLRRKGTLAADYRTLRADAPEESDPVRRIREGKRPYRPLEIHRYRPHEPLSGADSVLDFRLTSIDRMLDAGYRTATEHDCAQEQCILPGERAIAEATEVRRYA